VAVDPAPQPPGRAVPVEVASDPPGAEVWVGDESRGPAPVAVTTGDFPVMVRVRRAGYLERSLAVTAADAPRVVVTLDRAPSKRARRPSPPSRPKGYIKIED
jgi:hypothetical protein